VRLGLEDLLAVIHSLDEPSRARVAYVLAETEMDARFKDLITHLAARAPAAVAGRWRSPVAAGRHPVAIWPKTGVAAVKEAGDRMGSLFLPRLQDIRNWIRLWIR